MPARAGFFALALVLHALGAAGLQRMARPVDGQSARPAPPPTLSAAGRAAALDASRRALAAARRPPPTPVPKAAEPELRPDRRTGQVVSLPPDPSGRRPKQTSRLAEQDSFADKETVSRHPVAGARDVMHERTVVRRGTARAEAPPQGRLEAEPPAPSVDAPPEAAPRGRARVLELPDQRARDRLVLRTGAGTQPLQNHDAAPAIRGNAERLRVDVGEPGDASAPATGGPRRTLTMAQLIPDVGVLARVAGAPAPDHLPDVARGEGTFLNAHGYRYASFFNRLHAQVAAVWHPQDEVRRRDPSGNIYGAVDRTTLVFVSLNDRGGLEEVVVQQSSGVAFLDQIAVDAFKRAAPFLHPPRGLPDEDGRVNFSFGFHLSSEVRSAFGAGF